MNITYLPGGPADSSAEKIDLSEYIRRGTQIDMSSHKIVNCGEASNENDVVTLRGLTAYYRKGTPLDMNQNQIKKLAPGTLVDDAATVGQCSGMLKAYDEALSRGFEALGKSSGGSVGSGLAGAAVGGATTAVIDRASATAGQYQEAGSSLLSAGVSIISNTANVIGNAIAGQVQDLRGKFVAKPIAENLVLNGFQIKLIGDGSAENDAVAMRQLRAYMTSESAQVLFALKSELLSIEANDLRYVNESELELKGAQFFVAKPIASNLDMATHRIVNCGDPVDSDDAVTLQHLNAESIRLQRLISAAAPRVKQGDINLNRQNIAIIYKGPNCVPVSLLIRSPNKRLNFVDVYIQEPTVLAGTYALFIARDRSCNGMPYMFYFHGAAGTNPTSDEREAAVLITES